MQKELPKILIITETFKSNTGGGITLSNLFYGYPKDKLANAIDAYFINQITDDSICENFYSLGSHERKANGIFRFIKSDYPSGKYTYKKTGATQLIAYTESKIKRAIRETFFKTAQFIGFNHYIFRTELSEDLKAWIDAFSPDIIYSQLGSLENMRFTISLREYTRAKLAVHIMDDWPRVIGNYGIFKKYWNKRIDNEFDAVISKADYCLSISEGMSDDYKIRYKRNFIPFHNPIDTELWLKHVKKDFITDENNIRILYAGRIGRGIIRALRDCIKAIGILSQKGMKIELQIQTTSLEPELIAEFNTFGFVKINPVIPYQQLPGIFSGVDLLLMPFDFSGEGFDFLRLSMPTKASEYMISGTPVLIYASEKLSITKHAKKYDWAKCVTISDVEILAKEIQELLANPLQRKQFSENAVTFAMSHFDQVIVRKAFQQFFVQQ